MLNDKADRCCDLYCKVTIHAAAYSWILAKVSDMDKSSVFSVELYFWVALTIILLKNSPIEYFRKVKPQFGANQCTDIANAPLTENFVSFPSA